MKTQEQKRKITLLPTASSYDSSASVTASPVNSKRKTVLIEREEALNEPSKAKESHNNGASKAKKPKTKLANADMSMCNISNSATNSLSPRKPQKRLSSSASLQTVSKPKQAKHVSTSDTSVSVEKGTKLPLSPAHPQSPQGKKLKQSSTITKNKDSNKKEDVSLKTKQSVKPTKKPRNSSAAEKDKPKQDLVSSASSTKAEKGKSASKSKMDTKIKVASLDVQATDMSDPMAMLMMMEGKAPQLASSTVTTATTSSSHMASSSSSSPFSPKPMSSKSVSKPSTSTPRRAVSKRPKPKKKMESHSADKMEESGSEGFSDWEDVYDHPVAEEKSKDPTKSVEITLDFPEILKHKKRKKKEFDWKKYLEGRVRRFKKEVALDMHKVHLLCLLSLSMRQNEELNDLTLTGLVLSTLPAHLAAVVSSEGSSGLERRVEKLLMWYKKTFSLEHVKHCSNIRLVLASAVGKHISEGKIVDARVWVLVFICILRTIGLQVRLVHSLQLMPFKVAQDPEKPGPSKNKDQKTSKQSSKSKPKDSRSSQSTSASKSSASSSKSSKSKKESSKSKVELSNKSSASKRKLSSRASSDVARRKMKEADEAIEESDDEEEEADANKKGKKKKREPNQMKRESSEEEHAGKILSASSSEGEEMATINRATIAGHDFWLEIYFPEKKRWVCFDCFKGQFGKPYSLENSATQPLTYVLAFKNDGGVKDVTPRYAKLWLSQTRKCRPDQEWWEETLGPYNTTPHAENMLEDDEIKGQLLVRPMPTSIADFKSHPLYALRRHLLKFEAIYPDSAIPLGYIKKEPIYARECVHTLHSRDNWLKEGRLVRLAEQPYKMVKSRPKWNKPKDNPDELDLELYGEWQTEKYIPPPAMNGKVPKNEYGNLELFKPWMLPLGTVQLKLNGLQRVAKKLNIDVAPAMVGWDHHCGHAHPVFDGVVVCEEYADTLAEAWAEDQEIQEQRETEKREKRVYGNWRLLIRGLLIKMRLTQKFLQSDADVEDRKTNLLKRVEELKKQEVKEEEEKFSTAEPAGDVQQSWPRRQQDEVRVQKVKAAKLKVETARKVVEKGVGEGEMAEDGGKIEKDGDRMVDLVTERQEETKVGISKTSSTVSNVSKGNGRRAGKMQARAVNKSGVTKTAKAGASVGPRRVGSGGDRRGAEEKGKRAELAGPARERSRGRGTGVKSRRGGARGGVARVAGTSDNESDSEEEFAHDEVDGGKPGVDSIADKAAKGARPKRRSVAVVKYCDSDEEGDDFIDDSDNDSDFDVKKEKREKESKKSSDLKILKRSESIESEKFIAAKIEHNNNGLSEEDSSEDENGDTLEKSNFNRKETEKGTSAETKDLSRHWLDEDGSSSDEDDDFVLVTPNEASSLTSGKVEKEMTDSPKSDEGENAEMTTMKQMGNHNRSEFGSESVSDVSRKPVDAVQESNNDSVKSTSKYKTTSTRKIVLDKKTVPRKGGAEISAGSSSDKVSVGGNTIVDKNHNTNRGKKGANNIDKSVEESISSVKKAKTELEVGESLQKESKATSVSKESGVQRKSRRLVRQAK